MKPACLVCLCQCLTTTSFLSQGRLNISDAGSRFIPTKLASAAVRGALTLAVLSALLLITARPARAQTETVLYTFTGSNGDERFSNLTPDGKGNFYGTTPFGGAFGSGTVFELSPNGSGGWTESIVYSFTGGADGARPYSNVILDSAGNLYGTTLIGGANGAGVVFELSPAGGSWTETVLYSPAEGQAAAYPETGLIRDSAGNLYGSTSYGVFEVSPSAGGWTARKIYTAGLGFHDFMVANLTMDAAGNIFSTSITKVFELSPDGQGGWKSKVIHKFTGGPTDGDGSEGTLVFDEAGNLYGTTQAGGLGENGTVFDLSPAKHGKWTEKILYFFQGGSDGANPSAGVVLDAAGNIYGTAGGGANGYGTVFELVAPVSTGSYDEKVLWSFNGTDGANPSIYGSLSLDSAGNLYGTTDRGGSSQGVCEGVDSRGVIFEVTPAEAAITTSSLSNTAKQPVNNAATSDLFSPQNPAATAKVAGPDLAGMCWSVVKLVPSQGDVVVGNTEYFTASLNQAVECQGNFATCMGEEVVLYDFDKQVATATLNDRCQPGTLSANLSAGTHYMKVDFEPFLPWRPSYGHAIQVVDKYPTTTTLTSSPNPSTYKQEVTFTATVTAATGNYPTRKVKFMNGATTLGFVTLNNGVATFTKKFLPVGTNSITAEYTSDSFYAASVSAVLNQVVNPESK